MPHCRTRKIDYDELKSWVAVVDEEHDLNREERREEVAQWLGRTCPDILLVKTPKPCTRQQLEFGIELCLWQHHRGCIFFLSCQDAKLTRTLSECGRVSTPCGHCVGTP